MPETGGPFPQALTPHAHEIRGALGDWLLAKTTFERDDLNPVALQLLRDGADLVDLAVAINRAPLSTSGPAAVRMLMSEDFPKAIIEDGLAKLLTIGYQEGADEYQNILFDLPTPNFKPVTLPAVDLGELTPAAPLAGLPETPFFAEDEHTTDAIAGLRPYTYTLLLNFSRELLINDNVGLIASVTRALGQAAAAVEVKQIAFALESSSSLTDGSQLFTAANSTTAGLDVAGLNAGFGLLRTQATPKARKANLPAAVLLVPPGEIVTALLLNESIGNVLKVVVNPHLASGARYLFAPPNLSRSMVRMRLERSSPGPKIYQRKLRDHDGIAVEVVHDVGIFAANRLGVVRLADA